MTSFVLHVYHKDDMAAKTGRVEDVEKVQVDGLVSIRWLGMVCVCTRERVCVMLVKIACPHANQVADAKQKN